MPEAAVATPEAEEAVDQIETPESTAMAGKLKELLGNFADKPLPAPSTKAVPDPKAPAAPTPADAAPKPGVEVPPQSSTPAEPDDAPPSIRSEAGKQSWRELKKTFSEKESRYKSEIDTLKRQIGESRNGADNGHAEALAKAVEERDKYRRQLEQAELLSSEEFGGHFQKELDTEMRLVKTLVGPKHSEEVTQLLLAPDSQRKNERLKELTEELGERTMSRLNGVMDRLDKLNFEKQEALTKIDENYKRLKEIRQQKEREEQAQQLKRVKDGIDGALRDAKRLPAFSPLEGDEKHNSAIPEREKFVADVLAGRLSDDRLALVPVWAVQGLWYQSVREPELTAKIQTLETQIKELSAAQPSARSSSPANVPSEHGEMPGFAEKFNEAMGYVR